MLKLTNIDNIVKLEYGNWISWYSKTLLSYEIINDEILKVYVIDEFEVSNPYLDTEIDGVKITKATVPDVATIVLAGLLNTLNINVACAFFINGTIVDTKFFSIARTGTNQSYEFSTIQNLNAGDIVSVRLTPAFSVGSCSVAASPTSNFITIM